MSRGFLSVHPALVGAGRIRSLTQTGERMSSSEVAALVLAGFTAAVCSTFIDINLRLPGNAILLAVFPMSLGLALVPRRTAGTVMGASALVSLIGFRLSGGPGMGFGASTSLCITGPMLDLALHSALTGWRLYAGFILAGMGANFIAFLVRFSAKVSGFEGAGKRSLFNWLSVASWSYLLCGAIAGAVSCWIWFRIRKPRQDPAAP